MRPFFVASWLPLFVLALLSVFTVLPVVVDGTAVTIPTTITVSVNTQFIPLMRRAHTAYTLNHPEFTRVTFASSSGSTGGIKDAISGAFDLVVSTNPIPYAMQPSAPNVKSYPFFSSAYAPFYNFPVKTVGSAQLVLTMLAMCQIWRKNITVWSVEREQLAREKM
jgi:ABC-type phosphate transport system substrate-binding protein